MKYVKYYLVDPTTQKVIHPTAPAPNGRTHPSLVGLDVRLSIVDADGYSAYIATCDTGNTIDPQSGIEELTETEAIAAIEGGFNKLKEDFKLRVYARAKRLREQLVDQFYHHTEISYGASVKRKEAEDAKAAATESDTDSVAPTLAIEASFRGVTTKELADMVILEFNELKDNEAKLAGIRGNKTDALKNTTFDNTSFETAVSSVQSLKIVDIDNGWD